jgi:hypothetical protein
VLNLSAEQSVDASLAPIAKSDQASEVPFDTFFGMSMPDAISEISLDREASSIGRARLLTHKNTLGSRWNARRDAASGESVSECITIIALVGNNRLGVWQHRIDQSRALMVTHLSFCEKKDNWPASAIANRVQFGV